MDRNMRILVIGLLVIIAAMSRLLPHPANFTPVIAIAFFAGVLLGKNWTSYVLPILAIVLSDFFIGFHGISVFVYAAIAVVAYIGANIDAEKNGKFRWLQLLGGGIGGAFAFFVITNLAVWWTTDLYSNDLSGIWQCFVMAIPFFRSTLTSTGLYLFTLFGLFALAKGFLPVGEWAPRRLK